MRCERDAFDTLFDHAPDKLQVGFTIGLLDPYFPYTDPDPDPALQQFTDPDPG